MKLTTFSTAKKTKNETKLMRDAESASKVKGKVIWDIFRNFAYVSSYLHLKSFVWKRDCTITLKLKKSQT